MKRGLSGFDLQEATRYRGDWAVKERAIFETHGYRDGDAIAGDFFPQLWAKR
jgi:hypothetical protein